VPGHVAPYALKPVGAGSCETLDEFNLADRTHFLRAWDFLIEPISDSNRPLAILLHNCEVHHRWDVMAIIQLDILLQVVCHHQYSA